MQRRPEKPRRIRDLELLEDRCLMAAALAHSFGQMPLTFERNDGQAAASVDFQARGPGYNVLLTGGGAELTVDAAEGGSSPASLHMNLVGADSSSRAAGQYQLPGTANYILGNDPAGWQTNVPTFARVRYDGVYPGIDVIYYGAGQRLEYDFVVSPGSDPATIRMAFDGAENVAIDREGNLLLTTGNSTFVQHAPVAFQEIAGTRQPVDAEFVRDDAGQVGFHVGEYDTSLPLVIDPVLSFSTYYGTGGGGSEEGMGIVVDAAGNSYIVATTPSDILVVKLDSTGTNVVYSTTLGGNGTEGDLDIAIDGDGNVYVGGTTSSDNFPTVDPIQPIYGGGPSDAFVLKLNSLGTDLLYSTYLGGSGYDRGYDVAVAGGEAIVVGQAYSSDFPTSANALDRTLGGTVDGFVTRLNAAGSEFVYSTYLGADETEAAYGVATDLGGNAYVSGFTRSTNFPTLNPYQANNAGINDAFVTKFNSTGEMVYSTYLGSGDAENAVAIAVDSSGNAYVTGAGFGQYTYVAKVSANGQSRVYLTYFGGSQFGYQSVQDIAVDSNGSAWITGYTQIPDITRADPIQAEYGGGTYDVFITKLAPSGLSLLFSSYLGGTQREVGNGIAVDSQGDAYVTGYTTSDDFPTVNAIDTMRENTIDAIVFKITGTATAPPPPPPPPPPAGSVPAVSFQIPRSASVESISANIAVVLSRASTQTVTVGYSVSDGTASANDYRLFGSSLTFSPGETIQYIPVAIVDDLLDEPNEPFTLALSNPNNATLGKRRTHTHTIIDNDAPPIVGFQSGASNGAENVTQPFIDVLLSAASDQAVTVNLSTKGSTASSRADFVLASRSIRFEPGETMKTIPITVLDDSEIEATETIRVKLSKPRGATLGPISQHTYSISDNDAAIQSMVFANDSPRRQDAPADSIAGSAHDRDLIPPTRQVRRTR